MTTSFQCDEKERLVAYLYGELGDADRAAIERHLRTCAPCTEEIRGLRAVRVDLTRWQPPDVELGFRVVRDAAAVVARPWWRPPIWVPTALAAGLLLAVGAALANVRVEVGKGMVTLRAGYTQSPAAVQAAAPAPSSTTVPVKAGMSEAEVRQALAALETKLRADFAASRPASVVPVSMTTAASTVDRGEVLQQVKTLVDESERRQNRELALRLAQLVQDFDTQRRADLVRFEQGFGQIETLTAQEAARQRNINNYLVRASQRQPQ